MKVNQSLMKRLQEKNVNLDFSKFEKQLKGGPDSNSVSSENSFIDKSLSMTQSNFRVRPLSAVPKEKTEADGLSTVTSNFFKKADVVDRVPFDDQNEINNKTIPIMRKTGTFKAQERQNAQSLQDEQQDKVIYTEVTPEIIQQITGLEEQHFDKIRKCEIRFDCTNDCLQALGQ